MAARTWLIVGTIPEPNCEVIQTHFSVKEKALISDNLKMRLPLARGLGALVGASLYTLESLATSAVDLEILLAGDVGSGSGSRKLYATLIERLAKFPALAGITFHYLYPDVDWHNRILLAVEELNPKPLLVADAGFMYAAKMSGYADHYDLFTPDHGELAFLADANAPHPFYTRGFFLDNNRSTRELINKAYADNNAAKWLIVKGRTDAIVCQGEIKAQVADPMVPAMEAIGGTGDLVVGVASGLLAAGFDLNAASLLAAQACRMAGALAQPTPATQIEEILPFIQKAINELLNERQEV